MESLRGHLLVSSPALEDPNFERTVVVIAEHNEEGAMGLVLNRVSVTPVLEAVPDLDGLVEEDDMVSVGGPVQPQAVIVLAELDDPSQAAMLVVEDVGLVAAAADVDALPGKTRRARVFAGYAGWGPGQLEDELERKDWVVDPVRVEDIFDTDPEDLWAVVLERKGGRFAMLARMPADPSVN